jgi:DNA polymerase-1
MLVWDIETDGLLDEMTHVKCINIIDRVSGREERYTDYVNYLDPITGLDLGIKTPRRGNIMDGLDRLSSSPCIGGHNIIGFDIPALRKLYPGWHYTGQVRDSTVELRVIYTDIYDRDVARIKSRKLPKEFEERRYIGTHRLAAWGIRLGGEQKADFDPKDYGHTWKTYHFSKECDDYCMQDVRTNVNLFDHIDAKGYSEECLRLENDVATIITRQEHHGWKFDVPHAERLVSELTQEAHELHEQCSAVFSPWYVVLGEQAGKNFAPHGTVKGCPWTKISWNTFNPGSRDHIADRLQKLHGWVPSEFTDSGKPKIDEEILETLPYPECHLLTRLFRVQKMLGQLALGKQSWLKAVKANGRVHGRVNSNGAVTGRMTHSNPNVAQADKDPRMRACWIVPAGKRLVGCDAEGLELRVLAHYMAKYDGGAYAETVVNGRREDGTDVHTTNQHAVGLNSRDSAKTWCYAFLYGAGDFKLGEIVYADFDDEKKQRFNERFPGGRPRQAALARLGKRSRSRIAEKLPALAKLISTIKDKARRGFLIGLDGRRIHVRSTHASPNSLFQSAGAVIMKQALVIMFEEYDRNPKYIGRVHPVGNIHDEVQLEVDEEIADEIGLIAADSIRLAGEYFNFRCPLAGAYDVGDNWSQTH